MIGNHWQPMSLLNNASYCFYVGIQLSHNRLVAGSNPAGATKFIKDLDRELAESFLFSGF